MSVNELSQPSRYNETRGILFAADLDNRDELFRCIEKIGSAIAAIKIGNIIAYKFGMSIIEDLKKAFGLPVVADLKITDVDHVASNVVRHVGEAGADVVVVSGICGPGVVGSALLAAPSGCEVWLFTEFTCIDGLIDETTADESIAIAYSLGVRGFQVPATRPERIRAVRARIGSSAGIMACGIGQQGGKIEESIRNGANWVIIGRSIYAADDPRSAALEFRRIISGI